jgi:hypothetical protein
MDARIDWLLSHVPESVATLIALLSLVISTSAYSRTVHEIATKRRAHSRAAVSVAEEVLPPLADFIRSPQPREANAVLGTKTRWRELDRYAAMAERRTRKAGQAAVQALGAWEEAWREYNYNPHTEERYASAKRAAGMARDRVASLTTR